MSVCCQSIAPKRHRSRRQSNRRPSPREGANAPGGPRYMEGWVETNFDRCFQLMECEDANLLRTVDHPLARPRRIRICAGSPLKRRGGDHELNSDLAFLALYQEGRKTDRKSTRLNSSHGYISYAVFCLKKKEPTGCRCGPTIDARLSHRTSKVELRTLWIRHDPAPGHRGVLLTLSDSVIARPC